MSKPKILKTKKERLVYIEKIVKRNNKARAEAKAKAKKEAEEAMKYTETDSSGY